jgi:hypothetical protein
MLMFSVLCPFVLVDIGMAAYSGPHQSYPDVRPPLVNIIEYIQIFEPGGSKDAIVRLKWAVVERAIAKGVLSLSSQPGKSVWDFAKGLSGEEFLILILNDAMKQERQSITDQLRAWEMDLMKVAIFFSSSPYVESAWFKKLQSIHLTLNESSWVLPGILWYYFSLEDRAEDYRIKMEFKNSGAIGNEIFSEGSVLLVWPTFFYSTLFPRNFFGRPMPRTNRDFTKLDQIFIGLGNVLDEFRVDQRERMNIYSLFREIRQNPALILSSEFAATVAQRQNGLRTLGLLSEVDQIFSARQRLLASQFLRGELARRPSIAKMYGELATLEGSTEKPIRGLCRRLLHKFSMRDRFTW